MRRSLPAAPTATILPSAWSATPLAVVGAPEVGRLPAVAGEARVERAVRVVAGEREVAASAASPTATILPSAWSATPSPSSRAAEVGRLLAVAGEGRVEVAGGGDGRRREAEADDQGDEDHPRRPWSQLRQKLLTQREPHSDQLRRRPSASAIPSGLVGESGDRPDGQASHSGQAGSTSQGIR